MDPQAFIRLSIGSLGLRIPVASKNARVACHESSSLCSCEIRLRGFPVQKASVPFIFSTEANPDPRSNATIFYLEDSNVKALLAPRCLQSSQAYLEIVVYMDKQGSGCGISSRRQQIGSFRVEVRPEWGEGKPALLHSGWINIGKNSSLNAGKPGHELHSTVKLDPDPRYIFQFEDKTSLSPQIAQIQGTIKQPIFSCKFSLDRRFHQLELVNNYCSSSNGEEDYMDRERKGWKVMIHDLSGSAIAVAFMATPFVPSMGCDRVARSSPGSWLILRPGPAASCDSWHPWGRLEAWRESRDAVCLRFHLLPEGQENGIFLSETMINTDKGGEFFIDMDRQMSGGVDYKNTAALGASIVGGFVMNCRVQGEGKNSRLLVQLGIGHVTCVEDAAIFMALAAAVDLSIEACRPFRRTAKRGIIHSFLSLQR